MIRNSLVAATALALGLAAPTTPVHAQFEAVSVQAFHAADTNGDEFLNLAEFRTFIGHLANAGAPLSTRIHNLGAHRIAFNRVDANRDGVATPQELRSAGRNH